MSDTESTKKVAFCLRVPPIFSTAELARAGVVK
jgi:hypothetical protein